MALGVRRWVLLVLAGWALLALLLRPTDEVPRWHRMMAQIAGMGYGFFLPSTDTTEEARVRQELDRTAVVWYFTMLRDSVGRVIDRQPIRPGPRLLDWSGQPPARREALSEGFARILAPAGELGGPHEAGSVLVAATSPTLSTAAWRRNYVGYVFPDSGSRRPCIVLEPMPAPAFEAPRYGPCAYGAAFGAPGPAIFQWLQQGAIQLANAVDWAPEHAPGPRRRLQSDLSGAYGAGPPGLLWLGSREELKCRAGDRGACLDLLVQVPGSRYRPAFPDRVPGVILASRVIWADTPFRVQAGEYLADLIRIHGREKFARFWSSPLPVPDAFRAAFGEDMEDWTYDWVLRRMGPAMTGPSLHWGGAVMALGATTLLLGLVMAGATRRQAV